MPPEKQGVFKYLVYCNPLLFGLQALCHKEYLSALENIQTHIMKFTIDLSQFIVKQGMQDQKEDRWSKVVSIRKAARIVPQLSTSISSNLLPYVISCHDCTTLFCLTEREL